MSKRYLITEMTEFNLQRMGTDNTPMAVHVDNPELSADAYDKNIDIKRQANVRLNNILHNVFMSGGDHKTADRRIIEDQEFTNLKVLRMVIDNVNITIYFSFIIQEKEYFGVIKKFDTENPDFDCECFRDNELYQNKEWQIRIKGLVIKILEQWMAVESGEYKALKDVEAYNTERGTLNMIKAGSTIEVLRSSYEDIVISVNNETFTIKGKNYYFFNYYFEPVENQ
jgi:hypothetical protein